MPSPKLHRALHAALAGCALASAAPASAQSVWDSFPLPKSDWTVFSGLTFSDNIARVADGPSDTTYTLGATGSFFKDEGRLRANVRASVWYEEYLNNTFEGELLGAMAGYLRYDIVPDRVSWTIDNTYGQTAPNTFQPASPGNRSNTNAFSTGPDVTLRLGQVAGIRLGGRYELSTFENDSQLDEERLRGNVGVFRRFSGTTTGSINASLSETTFQGGSVTVAPGQFATGYDIREGYGRFETRRARYALSVDAGVTEVEQRGVKEDSPLLRLNFYRRLTPSLDLNVGAGQEYRTSSDILREAIAGVRFVGNEVVYIPPGIDPAFVYNVIEDVNSRSQPVKYQFARGSLDFTRPRTVVSFSLGAGQERFQFSGQSLDRDVLDVGVRFSRRLRPNLTGSVSASYYDRQFVTLDGGDDNVTGSIQASWQYSSQIAFNAGYRYDKRNSDIGAFSYTENALFVGISYGRARQSMFANPAGGSALPAQTGPTSTLPSSAMPSNTNPSSTVPSGTAPRPNP